MLQYAETGNVSKNLDKLLILLYFKCSLCCCHEAPMVGMSASCTKLLAFAAVPCQQAAEIKLDTVFDS